MTKVFLADDEIVIREGIRNSFPWGETDYQLVGEAPDGEVFAALCFFDGVQRGLRRDV